MYLLSKIPDKHNRLKGPSKIEYFCEFSASLSRHAAIISSNALERNEKLAIKKYNGMVSWVKKLVKQLGGRRKIFISMQTLRAQIYISETPFLGSIHRHVSTDWDKRVIGIYRGKCVFFCPLWMKITIYRDKLYPQIVK